MNRLLLLCWVVLGGHFLHADNSRSTGGCDTLLTTDGRAILVSIRSESRDSVQFYPCGDTSGALRTLPRTQIHQIKRSRQSAQVELPDGARRFEASEAQVRLAHWLNVVAIFCAVAGILFITLTTSIGLIGVFWVGLAFLLLSGLLSIFLFLFTRHKPRLRKYHKSAERLMWLTLGPIAVVVLLGWLLFITLVLFSS